MIILIRHGETEWNKLGRKQGRNDSALTENGKAQAVRVAEVVKSIVGGRNHLFFSSPLGRARFTSEVVADTLNYCKSKIVLDDRLIEFAYGRWEGKSEEEIQSIFRDDWNEREKDKWNYVIPGGGESYSSTHERACSWLGELQSDTIILAVGHQVINRTIRGAYANFDPRKTMDLMQSNSQIVILDNGIEKTIDA